MTKKIALFFFIFFLTSTFALTHEASAQQSLPQIIAGLQMRYRGITTLKAKFTQESYSLSLQSSEESHGTVSFKKPGMMRWDYSTGKAIISNGTLIWVYEPDLAQVVETKIDPTKPGITTDFLTGIGRLDLDFNIKLLRVLAFGYELSLTPKRPMGNTKELIVVIERDFILKKTIAIDTYNNETRIEFHGIDINAIIPNENFEYTPQQGVKIIRP